MTEPGMDLLMWARGIGFQIAIAVFVFGVVLRLVEIFALGRKADVAPAKGDAVSGGLRTIFTRFVPAPGFTALLPAQIIGGIIFHFGLLFIVFFFNIHYDFWGITFNTIFKYIYYFKILYFITGDFIRG